MPTPANFQTDKSYPTVTIASGQTTSEAIDLAGTELCGVFVPAEFDGTTLTLTAAPSLTGTYVAVQDGDGNTFTITTAASKYAPVKSLFVTAGLQFVKLVAGTSQSTTDSVLTLAVRPV